MLSLLEEYLEGQFKMIEHAGPKTWVIEETREPRNPKDVKKKFIVNQYLNKNEKAKEAILLNKNLHKKNPKNVERFIAYDSSKPTGNGKYLFMKIEYCEVYKIIYFISSILDSKNTFFLNYYKER